MIRTFKNKRENKIPDTRRAEAWKTNHNGKTRYGKGKKRRTKQTTAKGNEHVESMHRYMGLLTVGGLELV